ncbi:MAG: hypothetical protein MHM6MM_008271, partial [Cercozoa sp. M6MM]
YSQVDAALKYLKSAGSKSAEFDRADFDEKCGVGVVVSEDRVKELVMQTVEKHRDMLVEQRYRAPLGKLLGEMRGVEPWADTRLVKQSFDAAVLDLLGPKTEADMQKKKQKKPKKPKQEEQKQAEEEEEEVETLEAWTQGRDVDGMHNDPAVWAKHEEHLKALNVPFITRFPPEPNGHLHIGHAKAINFDFGLAMMKEGKCVLRMDDTNPAAEKQEYIDSIINSVRWLGFTEWKVTHSSDYFQELYDLAEQLIKMDKAFVCHMKQEDMQRDRKAGIPSPWRDRPIEESLAEFRRMRDGEYEEGAAVLRLKIDVSHNNPNMRDPIAYRIIKQAHPRTGDKWVIYPSYDYTHCIVDSLEHVSASCCTMEFETRRESYFWLLDVLGLYKPVVWEFSRLNLEYTLMSKRCLKAMVEDGVVDGWSDPRMFTLNGLRNRGIPPEAINAFVTRLGKSSRNVTNVAQMSLFHSVIRETLEPLAVRGFGLPDPVRVVATNWADLFDGKEDHVVEIECPDFPADPSRGSHKVPLEKVFYIDRSDFRVEANKKFFGLAPGRTVRLRNAFNVTYVSHDTDEEGKVTEVRVAVDPSNEIAVKKGFLSWVSQPVEVEAHLLEELFGTPKPDRKIWREQINPTSRVVVKAMVDKSIAERAAAGQAYFQFQRFGYFFCDQRTPTNEAGQLVFQRTLPQSSGKKAKAGI